MDQFDRTKLLIGKENLEKIRDSKIIIFGVGGVGGYCVEALIRAGIENITIVDNDTIDITNLNRQIIANVDNIGQSKVDVIEKRISKINPNAKVKTFKEFYLPQNNSKIFDEKYDYIIDAIDTVSAKISLVEKAKETNTKIISCMGTGNKLDSSKIEITDIYKTKNCKLAKVIRQELRKRKIEKLKVIYSSEEPVIDKINVIPSISYIPGIAGLMMAGEVIRDIIREN